MTLEIIGAGFGRTGTMSTYLALKQLGFPCYHMMEVLENKANKAHLGFWRKVANAPAGTQHDWEQAFAGYTASVDNPGCCVWKELMVAYPDAKVLLTLHPKGPDAWYESTIDTIYFTETMWQFRFLALVTPFGRKFGDMSRKLIWQCSHRGTMNDRTKAIAHYRQHVEEVKSSVPADRLLIFSVDQGWEPLCKFLGVPVPAGAFPNVNDRGAIKKVIAGLTKGAYIILGLAGLAAAAALYAVVRALS
ncbi:MAG: sulfotransferase family protein [Methylovirgula sp.]